MNEKYARKSDTTMRVCGKKKRKGDSLSKRKCGRIEFAFNTPNVGKCICSNYFYNFSYHTLRLIKDIQLEELPIKANLDVIGLYNRFPQSNLTFYCNIK